MAIFQFTGLSGAGKTTLANLISKLLLANGLEVEIIDGDQYRRSLCADLGFSKADREENIRRLGAVANTFSQQGKIALISAINPYESVRKELYERYNAKVIWIRCDLDTLFKRDTKGLYSRSMLPDSHPDKIFNLTGVNDEYQDPVEPSFEVFTGKENSTDSALKIADFIRMTLK